MPADSEYNTNKKWLDEHFKTNERSSIILFKADNVLTPRALDKVSLKIINLGKSNCKNFRCWNCTSMFLILQLKIKHLKTYVQGETISSLGFLKIDIAGYL